MKHILKKHWIALLFAFIVGVSTSVPQLIAINRAGVAWQGVYPTQNDDEVYYQARVREVYDGYSTIAQPYLKEGKDGSPLQFWLPDVFVGFVGMALHLSVQEAFILFDGVAPLCIFLLLYSIGYTIFGGRGLALTFGILMSGVIFFSTFSRPVSPQITIIPLFIFIYALYRALQYSEKRWLLLATFAFGSLFHMYTYYWTYAVVFLFLLGGGLFFLKDEQYKKTLTVLFGGTIIGIPYFIQLVHSASLLEYTETVARLGMIHTHFPSGILIVGLAGLFCVATLFFLYTKRIHMDRGVLFVVALVCATPIVTNHHIITGQNLEFSSHYRTLGIIFAALGFFFLWQRASVGIRYGKYICIGALGVVVGLATGNMSVVIASQTSLTDEEISLQRYGPILSWMRTQDEQGKVYFANQTLSALIPAYTSQNVFYAREANLHFMSDEEVMNRFVLTHYFDSEFSTSTVLDNERAVFGTYYINDYQHYLQREKAFSAFHFPRPSYERFSTTRVQSVMQEWNKVQQNQFRNSISKYQIDYLIWDTRIHPSWNIEDANISMEKRHESNGIVIFEVGPNG